MAFKKIVKIWDDLIINKSNIDFLTSKTDVVKFPLTKYDKKIIKDLKDTADRIDCAGIAANQIGHTKRIFIGYSDNSLESYKIYINPRIILKYQKQYATPETKCFATYSGEKNNYLSSSKHVMIVTVISLETNHFCLFSIIRNSRNNTANSNLDHINSILEILVKLKTTGN